MQMLHENFACLTKITFGKYAGHNFSANFPHCCGRISARTTFTCPSIPYPAKYCRALRVFTLVPYLRKHGSGSSRPKRKFNGTVIQVTQAVVLALAELAVRYTALESLVVSKTGCKDGSIALKHLPWYLCEDTVLEEASTIFRTMSSTI
jgi:hypothetical protein